MKSSLLVLSILLTSVLTNAQQTCASAAYLDRELRNNPGLADKLAAIHTSSSFPEVLSGSIEESGSGLVPIIRIPVVVHVVYRTADQNISDAQVLSQIKVLNDAFRYKSADTANIPTAFRGVAADCRIEFVMASISPKGYITNGIVRRKSDVYAFGYDDKIKFSSSGGDDAWDSDRYLNIWVGNLTTGLNGYSSIPGNDKTKDGIVLRFDAFGATGKLEYPFTKGHTAVHEVGHWLGLKHIWGDQYCGNDGIDDTPTQNGPTRGCPSSVKASCDNAAVPTMTNNYMDLTNDECTNMFTIGQREKMRSLFQEGGVRYRLLSSDAATAIGLPEPAPVPEEVNAGTLSIFPNPASSFTHITLSGSDDLMGKQLVLYNHLGQQVLQTTINKQNFTVNLQQLKDGVYYMKAGNATKAVKLVKTSGSSL